MGEHRAGPSRSSGEARGLTERLAGRREVLGEEMAQVAGGDSLCTISKSAGSVPAAKYLEGRMVVVLEVERALRRGGDARGEIAATRRRWSDELERAVSTDWRAYRAGGVDEADLLMVALLDGGDTGRRSGPG